MNHGENNLNLIILDEFFFIKSFIYKKKLLEPNKFCFLNQFCFNLQLGSSQTQSS